MRFPFTPAEAPWSGFVELLLMSMFPPDHAQRITLADEAHARPPETVRAPARASYVAVLIDADDRSREIAHLTALCERHAVEPPEAGASHFRARLGNLRLKWERHGEFSGYTVIAEAEGRPFETAAAAGLPPTWLATIPGATIAAVQAEVMATEAGPPDGALLAEVFAGNTVIGAEIADGAALVYTDFQLHDGCTRFVLADRSLTERQTGRTLQRLFEIEAYRILALLALPIARRQSPRILAIEQSLGGLTDSIARGAPEPGIQTSDAAAADEALLGELTRLAAEVESGLAASQFRFGACEAYYGLVMRRIAELRERRLAGTPTIEEFMSRRFTPAVATCRSVQQRLAGLSERVARASGLLSTRVDIARERQSQALLASMDRRARLQLRLQQTVEGLSVAAIVYYGASIFGYLAKAAQKAGLPVSPELATGLALPLIALFVVLTLRRARRNLERDAARTGPRR